MGNAGTCSQCCSEIEKATPQLKLLLGQQSQAPMQSVRHTDRLAAEFHGSTSDPALASNLAHALAHQLAQSEHVSAQTLVQSEEVCYSDAIITVPASEFKEACERDSVGWGDPSRDFKNPREPSGIGSYAGDSACASSSAPDVFFAATNSEGPNFGPASETGTMSMCAQNSWSSNFAPASEAGTMSMCASSSDSTAASRIPDVGQAQQQVKEFVRAYVKGHGVVVLSVNGGKAPCVASLDRKLSTLSLARSAKKVAKKRDILLENITEICVGEEAGDEVDLPIDNMCVTLLLDEGQAVGFRFDDVEERDVFAMCLTMFVDGRQGEIKKKEERRALKQSKAGGA